MNKLKSILILFLSISFLFLTSCNEDDTEEIDTEIATVIIINEGNFFAANGSFDLFNWRTTTSESDVFQSANNFPVGATIQNAIIHEDLIIATTNAADKVEFIDKNTFESKGFESEGLATPFSVAANNEYAFVTAWGTFNNETFVYDDPKIVTLSLETYEVISTLDLSVQPQHIVEVGERFYVSDIGNNLLAGNTVSVYTENAGVLSLAKTISTPTSPDKMIVDANNHIWVLCASGSLIEINTTTDEVITTIENVPSSGFNEKMAIDPDKSMLFWIGTSGFPDYNSAVYRTSISDPMVSDPIIEGDNFYGLGMDENTLYVGDHAAYQAAGTVLRYADYLETPTALSPISAGLAPNGFVFR